MTSAEDKEKKEADFCPKIAPVDQKVTNLSYNQRLKHFEDEAQSLYTFCLQREFSGTEIETCVSKLRGPSKATSRKALEDSTCSLVLLSVFVAVAAVLYQTPYLYNICVAHGKLGMIKYVLPYWDWASLYKEDCLISNVFLPVKNVTYNKRTCQYCINVVKYGNNVIDRLNNTDEKEINKHYIENDQPVVITDTTKMWKDIPELNMDVLAELYQIDPFLSTVMGSCMYKTNVGFNETFYDFITAYVNGKLPNKWHISWQNCESKAAKILRRYYVRPYFLPGMAQAGIENTIIAASGKHVDEEFEVYVTEGNSAHWLTVLSGSLHVRLTPFLQCREKYECQVAEVVLDAGETGEWFRYSYPSRECHTVPYSNITEDSFDKLFYNDDQWVGKYTVTSDATTIALASSVIWDEMNTINT